MTWYMPKHILLTMSQLNTLNSTSQPPLQICPRHACMQTCMYVHVGQRTAWKLGRARVCTTPINNTYTNEIKKTHKGHCFVLFIISTRHSLGILMSWAGVLSKILGDRHSPCHGNNSAWQQGPIKGGELRLRTSAKTHQPVTRTPTRWIVREGRASFHISILAAQRQVWWLLLQVIGFSSSRLYSNKCFLWPVSRHRLQVA